MSFIIRDFYLYVIWMQHFLFSIYLNIPVVEVLNTYIQSILSYLIVRYIWL